MTMRSSAWFTMYASCSGNRRMFNVCSTPPMQGMAKYASRCSWVFHANVATRSPDSTPRCRSAAARRSVRCATSVNDARRDVSPSNVTTSLSPKTVRPWRKIIPIVRGKSCIVDCMRRILQLECGPTLGAYPHHRFGVAAWRHSATRRRQNEPSYPP
jgi:hypothetical protein